METFISFKKLAHTNNYIFTKEHLILLLVSMVIIIFFSMYTTRQKTKFQKGFVFAITFLLTGLEVARIYWRYKYLEFNKQELSFLNVANIDIFTISLWLSIPIMFFASIKQNKKRKNIFGLNFVFSITTLCAIITLIYPIGLDGNFDFYHCYNILYALIRSFTIMLGLFFAFAKWTPVSELLNIWRSLLSLVIFGILCFGIYYFFGQKVNLFYIEYCPLFESLGVYLPFPLHLLLLGCFMFLFQLIIHLPFIIHRKIKNKHS